MCQWNWKTFFVSTKWPAITPVTVTTRSNFALAEPVDRHLDCLMELESFLLSESRRADGSRTDELPKIRRLSVGLGQPLDRRRTDMANGLDTYPGLQEGRSIVESDDEEPEPVRPRRHRPRRCRPCRRGGCCQFQRWRQHGSLSKRRRHEPLAHAFWPLYIPTGKIARQNFSPTRRPAISHGKSPLWRRALFSRRSSSFLRASSSSLRTRPPSPAAC